MGLKWGRLVGLEWGVTRRDDEEKNEGKQLRRKRRELFLRFGWGSA